jgi:hypothetical protein
MKNNIALSLVIAIVAAMIVGISMLILGYGFWAAFGMYSLTGACILVIPLILEEIFSDKENP